MVIKTTQNLANNLPTGNNMGSLNTEHFSFERKKTPSLSLAKAQ
jgi:hypothetical protein